MLQNRRLFAVSLSGLLLLTGGVVVLMSQTAGRELLRERVDEIFGDMTGAGHRGLVAPHDAFWGARYALLEDPDGIAVGLMSPVSHDKRSPPPQV